MANKKISELDLGSALDGSEFVPVVQGGATVRVPASHFGGGGSYTEMIGDASTTEFTINHALGTDYPIVAVWDLGGADPKQVEAEVESIDADNVKVTFSSAPAVDGMQVTVIGGVASGATSEAADHDQSGTLVDPTPTLFEQVPDLGVLSFGPIVSGEKVAAWYSSQVTKGNDGHRNKYKIQMRLDGGSWLDLTSRSRYSHPVGEANYQDVSFYAVKEAATSADLVEVRVVYNAALGTSSTTFGDQDLTAKIIR